LKEAHKKHYGKEDNDDDDYEDDDNGHSFKGRHVSFFDNGNNQVETPSHNVAYSIVFFIVLAAFGLLFAASLKKRKNGPVSDDNDFEAPLLRA